MNPLHFQEVQLHHVIQYARAEEAKECASESGGEGIGVAGAGGGDRGGAAPDPAPCEVNARLAEGRDGGSWAAHEWRPASKTQTVKIGATSFLFFFFVHLIFHKDVDFQSERRERGKCWLLESLPPNGWNHTLGS